MSQNRGVGGVLLVLNVMSLAVGYKTTQAIWMLKCPKISEKPDTSVKIKNITKSTVLVVYKKSSILSGKEKIV